MDLARFAVAVRLDGAFATCPNCDVGGDAATLFRYDEEQDVLVCTEFGCVIRPPAAVSDHVIG